MSGAAEEELEELVLRGDGGVHRLVVALHGREVAGVGLPAAPAAPPPCAAPAGCACAPALTCLGLRRSSGFAGSPGRRLRRRGRRRGCCSGACAAAKSKARRRREDGDRALVDRAPAARRQQAPRLGPTVLGPLAPSHTTIFPFGSTFA